MSSPTKFVECLYCDVGPPPILSCLVFHLSQSSLYTHTFIHTIIHSCINTFTYSYFHSYTSYTQQHSCMVAFVIQIFVLSLQSGPHLSLCQAASSLNKQLAIVFYSKSVIPNIAVQVMSLINFNFKSVIPNISCSSDVTNQFQFQKCHPQHSCSSDVTNQFQFQFQ